MIFSTGCQLGRRGPDNVVEERVYSGTQGLKMSFLTNLPPVRIYDTVPLTIVTELENKGVSDLSGTNCVLHLHGYDDNIIRGIDSTQYCGDNLWEKSVSYPEGGQDVVEFETSSIYLPAGLDSLPQNFLLTACYEYETYASPIVCIDPQLYKIQPVEQACVVQDVSTGGGQGAPVSVDMVEVDMISENRVVFKIHITNVGGGHVLRPGSSLTQCLNLVDEYDYFNILDYDVDMSGGSMISCSPDEVRLTNDRATIFCTFSVSGDYAYTTPLQIWLRYNYMDSINKNVEIVATP